MRIIAIIMLLMQLGNVDLLHRPVYQQPDGSISTVETTQYWCGSVENIDFEKDVDFIIHITPIFKVNGVAIELSDEQLRSYIGMLLNNAATPQELMRLDAEELSLIMWLQPVANWDAAISIADTYDVFMHLLQEEYYKEE